MKKLISSILFLIAIGCEDVPQPVLELVSNPRLSVDSNGLYHLPIDTTKWQTLHRLSGIVMLDGELLEGLKTYWISSHYWYLGDTLGYMVSTGLNDELEYVNYDTSYVTWFDGYEVITINPASYSNSNGEINSMFAPVKSMRGDTVTITIYYYDDWNNFEYNEIQFNIVLD